MLIGQGDGQITEQVDELERSDQGIVLERSPEDAELDRCSVLQVDGRVAAFAISLLGVIQDFFGPVLIAVPSGPLLHLVGSASAEFEQFFPVFLEEVEQAIANDFIPVSLGESRLRTETAALYSVMLMNLKNSKLSEAFK